jgi:hypothetical protein
MKSKHVAYAITALAGAGVFVVLLSARRPQPVVPRLLNLSPGASVQLALGPHMMTLSVPAGPTESASEGRFRVELPSLGFDSGALERDGSVESVFVADCNQDAADDAVIVVRCAGSGSYVTLFCLLSGAQGYSMAKLPEPPSALMHGYQGHDAISVQNGRVSRTYPSYVDVNRLRLDRQWSPNDAIKTGESPIKSQPDSNSCPSGSDSRIDYDLAAGRWTRG